MFDLGMTELLLIGLVALLVLGPEKLPRAARTAGMYMRRARQSWYSMRAEIERELAAEEFKRSIRDTQTALSDSAQQLRDSGKRLQHSITGQLPPLESDPREQSADDTATTGTVDAGTVDAAGSDDEDRKDSGDSPRPS